MSDVTFKAYEIIKTVIILKYKEFVDKISTLLLLICMISTMLISIFKYNNIQMNPLTSGCIIITSILIPICCYYIKKFYKELDDSNLS